MSQGMASKAEAKANSKVQDLKPEVDEADDLKGEALQQITGHKLANLIAAVHKSINARLAQKDLPKDGGGHGNRVEIEQAILLKLNNELARRQKVEQEKVNEKNSKAMTSLPSNSTWGGPRKNI